MGNPDSAHAVMPPLTRLLCKMSLSFSLLFCVLLLLIHAQSYDDSEFRVFLIPADDCPSPCFMGIRPGTTTLGDAVAILQSHKWVKTVLASAPDPRASQHIYWQWRDDAPLFVQSGKLRNGGTLYVQQGIVQNIDVMTGIPLGTAWLRWDAPEKYTSLTQTGGPIGGPIPPRPLTYIYQDIIVIGWTECADFGRFWDAKIEIIFGDLQDWLQSVSSYPPLPGTTSIYHYVHDVKTNFCP